MVLQELGTKLTSAFRKLNTATVVNDEVLQTIVSEVCRALIEADVNIQVVSTLRKNIKDKVNLDDAAAGVNRRKLIQRTVMEELIKIVDPGTKPYEMKKGKSNVIMFVGLQGAGKTTTIAKFANFYQRKGWKTCMVCADTFRAGAFDQLRQNAIKLRLPFYGSYTEADPVAIALKGVEQFKMEHYEVIIVDTSGRHKQEDALLSEMREIQGTIQPDNVVFVMDATQGQAVYDQAKGFHEAVDVGSVVITKLDGHAKGGGALSAVAATKAPVIFLGSGEHFDDLDPFNAHSFISRLLGYGDVRGLVAGIKEAMDEKKGEELVHKMSKGMFSLRDMYEQFENLMKLGPLNKVMGMIPGMSQMSALMGNGQGEEGQQRIKKFMYMMDSMTDDELDGKVDIEKCDSRIRRIAVGSGSIEDEVRAMLKCHQQFQGLFRKMGKQGLIQGGDAKMQKEIQRNPNNVMQRLQKAMDPRMLQQFGGAKGMMQMMEQMGKMDMEGMDKPVKGGRGGGLPPGFPF